MVEVKKLRTFYDSCGARATLCGDRACRSALAVAPCGFSLPAEAGKSQLLSVEVVGKVHFRSPGWKITTFKYESISRQGETCSEQLAERTCLENLLREPATCSEQLAERTCLENLLRGNRADNLLRATC